MSRKLLDTTILVDLSRGNTAAADFVDSERHLGTELLVSVVSAMELIVGCRNKAETKKAEKLLTKFMVVQLSAAASRRAYELVLTYCKTHGLLIPDAFIAATAMSESLDLMSDNDRHFKMMLTYLYYALTEPVYFSEQLELHAARISHPTQN